MLIEHTFVTTHEVPDALRMASEMLRDFGFVVERESHRSLQVKRGIKHPAYAKDMNQLPQSVVLDFDRGRITLAVSIQVHGKSGPLHRQFGVAIAQVLEKLLAGREPSLQARQPWDDVQRLIVLTKQKARQRRRWLVLILFAVFALLCGVAIWMERSN